MSEKFDYRVSHPRSSPISRLHRLYTRVYEPGDDLRRYGELTRSFAKHYANTESDFRHTYRDDARRHVRGRQSKVGKDAIRPVCVVF